MQKFKVVLKIFWPKWRIEFKEFHEFSFSLLFDVKQWNFSQRNIIRGIRKFQKCGEILSAKFFSATFPTIINEAQSSNLKVSFFLPISIMQQAKKFLPLRILKCTRRLLKTFCQSLKQKSRRRRRKKDTTLVDEEKFLNSRTSKQASSSHIPCIGKCMKCLPSERRKGSKCFRQFIFRVVFLSNEGRNCSFVYKHTHKFFFQEYKVNNLSLF